MSSAIGRVRDAQESVTEAGRRSGYTNAQLTELLPDIKEEARLEIAERSVREQLEGNRERQAGLRKLLGLVRQVQARQPSEEYATKERKAAAELEQLEAEEKTLATEHEAQATRLATVRSKLAEKDKDLRKRFGLPDQD